MSRPRCDEPSGGKQEKTRRSGHRVVGNRLDCQRVQHDHDGGAIAGVDSASAFSGLLTTRPTTPSRRKRNGRREPARRQVEVAHAGRTPRSLGHVARELVDAPMEARRSAPRRPRARRPGGTRTGTSRRRRCSRRGWSGRRSGTPEYAAPPSDEAVGGRRRRSCPPRRPCQRSSSAPCSARGAGSANGEDARRCA